MGAVPLVRVVRSGLEESLHLGHVAVCDADGTLQAWAGDPAQLVFSRSCMKPIQATLSLAAIEDEPLSDREVAVMCGSHNGELVHVAAVRALLERSGVGSDALQNPPGWPLDPQAMARARHQSQILHNCSGKHAGMLLACMRSGWDPATYPRRSHPLQRRITRAVQRICDADAPVVGVDGCGLPVHGMPLCAMATLFARLSRPERMRELEPFAERAAAAMLAEPYLVGGNRRLDTDLMRETGDVVAKEGAEALVCASLLSSGIGVAVKIADGGWRATGPALLHALRAIGGITEDQAARLEPHVRPVLLGGGRRVGELSAIFGLRRRRR